MSRFTKQTASYWKQLGSVVRNEFRTIFKDGGVMLILIFALIIYATAYSLAYGSQVLRNVPIGVVDECRTPTSRSLIDTFNAGPNTYVAYNPTSMEEAKELFYGRRIYGVVYIPSDYEEKLLGGSQANVAIYVDASYFLMYRQVFQEVVTSIGKTGAMVEFQRLIAKGANIPQAQATTQPVIYESHNLFNPYLGYGTFVMPAIIMVIIQQTMLIGIGMIGGTWREFGLYRKLCPPDRKRMSTLPIVLGKATVYGLIYGVTTFYILGLHYRLFHYPMNGATSTVVVFMLAYLAACIFLGIAISTLFRYRENSLLLLLWTSIPLLMLSGVSYPREGIPDWLFNFGQLFPSSHGVDGFIRIQSMGASLSEVLPEIRMLCILTLIYGGLACIGIVFIMTLNLGRSETAEGRVSTWIHLWTRSQTEKPIEHLTDTERSMIAIHNGGVFGEGAGQSAMRVEMIHPESDYAYAFFVEEYGIVLALALLMLYLWIFFRGIEIFRRCGTAFPGLLVLGLALLITCQALLHIMVTVNLIPETGQTLPLISRGGSSMLFTMIAFGMILSVSRQNDEQSHDTPRSESIYEK